MCMLWFEVHITFASGLNSSMVCNMHVLCYWATTGIATTLHWLHWAKSSSLTKHLKSLQLWRRMASYLMLLFTGIHHICIVVYVLHYNMPCEALHFWYALTAASYTLWLCHSIHASECVTWCLVRLAVQVQKWQQFAADDCVWSTACQIFERCSVHLSMDNF
jgi:hypothetical protein